MQIQNYFLCEKPKKPRQWGRHGFSFFYGDETKLIGFLLQVQQDIFQKVCSKSGLQHYEELGRESFVAEHKLIWFCPDPNCKHAILFHKELDGKPKDVHCKCGTAFCSNCKEEAHQPVSIDFSQNIDLQGMCCIYCHTPRHGPYSRGCWLLYSTSKYFNSLLSLTQENSLLYDN